MKLLIDMNFRFFSFSHKKILYIKRRGEETVTYVCKYFHKHLIMIRINKCIGKITF